MAAHPVRHITYAYDRADVISQRPVIVSGYTSQPTLGAQQSEGVDGGDEATGN